MYLFNFFSPSHTLCFRFLFKLIRSVTVHNVNHRLNRIDKFVYDVVAIYFILSEPVFVKFPYTVSYFCNFHIQHDI